MPVLGSPEVSQSPCSDLAAPWGWVRGQAGCRRGREHVVVLFCLHRVRAGSHPSQLRALAVSLCQRPNLSEDRPEPTMGCVRLSLVWWLCPPLHGAACPGRARDAGSGRVAHRSGTDGFGAWGHLTLGLSCATSPREGGTLVPRHWGGDSPPGLMLEGGGPGSGHHPRVQTCAEQRFISC